MLGAICFLNLDTMKPNDTSLIARETIDAYLEIILGIMTLRITQVQDFLIPNFPEASVKASYEHEDLTIKVVEILNDFKKEGLKDVKSLQNSFRQVNRMFLLAMWDILCSHKTYDKIANKSEIQFFRHIRNGCAHNNKLNFAAIDKVTKWRDKEITNSDKGKNVFPDMLRDGDPILLVIDINNKYFHPIDLTKKAIGA